MSQPADHDDPDDPVIGRTSFFEGFGDVQIDLSIIAACLVLLTIIAIGWLLNVLEPIIKPLFVALFLYYMIQPISDWFENRNVPRWITYLLMVVLISLLVLIIGVYLYWNIEQLEIKLPQYQYKLGIMLDTYADQLGLAKNDNGQVDWERVGFNEMFDVSWTDVLNWLFGSLISFFGNLFIVIFYLVFLFVEGKRLGSRIRRAFPGDTADKYVAIGGQVRHAVFRYISIKTYMSLGTGAGAGLCMYLLNVDFWLFWAILTFLFNYIPYVGSLLASIFPIVIGAIIFQDQPLKILLLITLLVANQNIWGNVIEPTLLGREFNISPLALLVFVAFWGWVWGIVGMLLSVPLVVAIKIWLDNVDRARTLSILFSET